MSTQATVKGIPVQVSTQTQIGKNNGEKYVSVRIIKFTLNVHSSGKNKIVGYGKPQWVRESLIEK